MEQTLTPPPPSLSAISTAPVPPPAATYPDSLDSSPHSRNTDSLGEDNIYPNNGGTTTQQAGLTKLRLMCSYGGHIVPRPHDKSLCYVGGETRIVVVDRHVTLFDLIQRLSKTLLRSASSSNLALASATASFTLKYQLPSEDLDSLISVTTDEDLENMIDEYERLNSSAHVSKTSRLRLFLFPTKPDSASSIGSLLENSVKSEDWFLNALNGSTSGFSDTSSVNCLLNLDDDVSVPEKKGVIGKNSKANSSAQDLHSVPDLERTSSFGSASSAPSLASLPPIRVHADDNINNQKERILEEQFSQMSVHQKHQKQQDDGGYVAVPAPASVVVTGVPLSSSSTPVAAEYANPVFSEDERSDYLKQQQQQQQQYQQKQSTGFDLASSDSISSDGRQKPAMIYQDQLGQIQTSNNNRPTDLNNIPDQNTRIQMLQQQQQQQQQQQIADSAYLMSMSNAQVDPQHPQMHHQQPQFIHTAVPPPQYIQHHPPGAVPVPSYYQMYPPPSQHPHHLPIDQQNFVYYMPARQAPHGYNLQMQQQAAGYADVSSAAATSLSHSQAPPPPPPAYTTNRPPAQTAPNNELPAGVYGTTNSGAPQFVQVSSNQPQPQPQLQPQYVGYSQIHHPSQSAASSASGAGANYGYEFTDPAQGQHIYYAAPQQLPPQSAAQFQTVTADTGSYLATDHATKQQQHGRTQQP